MIKYMLGRFPVLGSLFTLWPWLLAIAIASFSFGAYLSYQYVSGQYAKAEIDAVNKALDKYKKQSAHNRKVEIRYIKVQGEARKVDRVIEKKVHVYEKNNPDIANRECLNASGLQLAREILTGARNISITTDKKGSGASGTN